MPKLFLNKKVFFASSVTHAPKNNTLSRKIINYLKDNGAKVLTEHIGAEKEKVNYFYKIKTGIDLNKIRDLEKRAKAIRKQAINLLNRADYFIAIVSYPSLGVGMELQYAISKHQFGFKKIPVLCLCDITEKEILSRMVIGIPVHYKNFQLAYYKNFATIKRVIRKFLS